jgi:membrane protease YdiL (CAAX protease family)
MTPSEPKPAWSPLAAFGLSIALLVLQLALATGLTIAGHRLVSGPSAPIGPATIAVAAIIASCVVAAIVVYLIGARAGRSEVLAMPRGGIATLVLVPLAFGAAAYSYQWIKRAIATQPAVAPSGKSVTASEVALLGDGTWLLFVSAVVVAPLMEELIFRGLMLPGLARSRLRFIGAALVTSVLFVLWHPGGAQKFTSFAVLLDWHLLMSLSLCVVWWLSRSVWPCVLGHAAANLAVLIAVLQLVAQNPAR